jgi:D-alanyl-D-alanine carboxypeptidase
MKFLLTFLFALVAAVTSGQHRGIAKLDSLLDALANTNQAMGSMVIFQNGNRIYSKAVGDSYINGYNKLPATEYTKYRIGSLTQMFTATMIFQLIDEGKLSLNTTLDKYYPQFPNSENITIEHLLRHRSGLYNFAGDPSYKVWGIDTQTEKMMLQIMAYFPPAFEAGERFESSVTNYVLLGYIIRRITRKSYNQNLRTRIADKAGMTNSYFGWKGKPKKGEALSYVFINEWKAAPETKLTNVGGGGAMLSTPTDLAMFAEALFKGKLVTPQSLATMKNMQDGIGMGVIEVEFRSKRGYGYSGLIDASAADVFYFPEDDLTIAYCSNGIVCPVDDIVIGALSAYYHMSYTMPIFSTEQITPPSAKELEKYIGVYASTQLPLRITIKKRKTQLEAQITGKSPFPLQYVGSNKFKFDPEGAVLEFNTEKSELTLRQSAGNIHFTKEKD